MPRQSKRKTPSNDAVDPSIPSTSTAHSQVIRNKKDPKDMNDEEKRAYNQEKKREERTRKAKNTVPSSGQESDTSVSSSVKGFTEAKKKIKDMNDEERKAYYREKKQEQRARKSEDTVPSSGNGSDTSASSFVKGSTKAKKVLKDMNEEEKKEYKREQKQKERARKAGNTVPSSGNGSDTSASSFVKGSTKAKKVLKDMNEEEKKEYKREQKQKERARKAGNTVPSSGNESDTSVPPDSKNVEMKQKGVTEEKKKSTREQKKTKNAENETLIVETILTEQFNSIASISVPSEKSNVDSSVFAIPKLKKRKVMTPAERDDYFRDVHQDYKDRKTVEEVEQSGTKNVPMSRPSRKCKTVCNVPETPKPRKRVSKTNSSNDAAVDSENNSPSSSRVKITVTRPELQEPGKIKHNCKVRFSMMNLFNLETDVKVVPFFLDENLISKGSIHSQLMRKPCYAQTKAGFDQSLRNAKKNDLNQVMLLSEGLLCVQSPVCKNKKSFTTVTEATLRANYFSILRLCDQHLVRSVGIPLLGCGYGEISEERSFLIGLQSIFTYFSVVEKTSLQLVYITVRRPATYERLGKLVRYYREFDLSHISPQTWRRGVENFMDQLKPTTSYVQFPGTDARLRVIKSTSSVSEQRECRKICVAMIKSTKVKKVSLPNSNKTATDETIEPEQFIQPLPVSDITLGDGGLPLLDLQITISRQCGTYSILRKMWVISVYVMYYSEPANETESNFRKCAFSNVEKRKEYFIKYATLHAKLVKLWNKFVRTAPYECTCAKTDGHHERLFIFNARLSHPDYLFDEWLQMDKTLCVNEDEVFQSLQSVKAGREFAFLPGVMSSLLLKDDSKTTEMIKERLYGFFVGGHRLISEQSRNTQLMFEKLSLIDPATSNFRLAGENLSDVSNDEELLEMNTTNTLDALKDLQKDIDEYKKDVVETYFLWYCRHVDRDLEREQQWRNRKFRKYFLQEFSDFYDENDDVLGDDCTVDKFIRSYIDTQNDGESEKPTFSTVNDTTASVSFDSQELKIAETHSLGPRDAQCFYCGAISFRNEKNMKCCKYGKVWVPPMKKLPDCVTKMFEKHSKILIQINSAHAMASLNYDRQPQAPHGVQAVKVRGQVGFMPSAILPRNPANPRYGNFFVIDRSDQEIVEMRMNLISRKNKGLSKLFMEFKKYMDRNNRMVALYKSMKELKEEAERDGIAEASIRFRIVPVRELDSYDLQAHKGVYADPDRMGKNYISVAFSSDVEMNALPRGMTIFLKNPKGCSILSMDVYDEKCDPLAYPLFFPNGETGYGWKKIERIENSIDVLSYHDRKAAEVARLEDAGEDPDDYFSTVAPAVSSSSSSSNSTSSATPMRKRKVIHGSSSASPSPSSSSSSTSPARPMRKKKIIHSSSSASDASHASAASHSSSSSSESESDYDEFDVDRILIDAEDEERQEAGGEIGKRPRIIMKEYKGQMYPVRDGEEEIPIVTNGFSDADNNNLEPIVEGLEDVEEPTERRNRTKRTERSPSSDHSEDEYYQFSPVPRQPDEDETGLDIDFRDNRWTATVQKEIVNKDKEEEEEGDEMDLEDDEDDDFVCPDDVDNAESTAIGKSNGGVVQGKNVKNVGKRKFVSAAEYFTFQLKSRNEIPSRFLDSAGKLGQLYVCDAYSRVCEMRMDAIASRKAEFSQAIHKSSLWKHLDGKVTDLLKTELGMLVTVPSTLPGSPKFQRELVMSAVEMSNELGHPDLFITFTGSPQWEEIKNNIPPGCDWSDCPDLVVTAFWNKALDFLDDVVGKKVKSSKDHGRMMRQPGVFGQVAWYTFSVEFQQRGMPHIHLLLSLVDHIKDARQIDEFVTAEMPPMPLQSDPDYEKKLYYRNCVVQMMLHTPCKDDATAYCNQGKKKNWKRCMKDFPKPLSDYTIFGDNQYPTYKRTRENTHTFFRNGKKLTADSSYVVAHNPYLLTKYKCHINVEVVTSIKMMKYMFKYIFKGSDRAIIEVCEKFGLNDDGSAQSKFNSHTITGELLGATHVPKVVIEKRIKKVTKLMKDNGVEPTMPNGKMKAALNECYYYQDYRAVTAIEALWRIQGRPIHGSSHTVHRAFVHEEGNEIIVFKRGEAEKALQKNEKYGPRTMFTAWFDSNKNPVKLPDGRMSTDLTYEEMFKYFKYDRVNKKFVLRKKDYSRKMLSRIQTPQPRFLELTAVRLLAKETRGATCFEDLRTFEGRVYETCLDAAKARRLMNNEDEWMSAMMEVGQYAMPRDCRRFFANILVACAPPNARDIFNENLAILIQPKPSWSQAQKVAHALNHIRLILQCHGMDLADFQLDDLFNPDALPKHISPDDNDDDPDFEPLTPQQHMKESDKLYNQLNMDQKVVVDFALELLRVDREDREKNVLFIDGPGGTGKTFCYNTIYHRIMAEGKKVLCVAHTGIAATLLPQGCTTHRMFHIPIEMSNDLACKIDGCGTEASTLRSYDAIIWDEACMSDRRIVDAVSNLFKDLHDNPDKPFGGTLVIMGGDWRQILPIVEGVRSEGVLDYTVKMSGVWNDVKQFKLRINQRAAQDQQFAEFILAVGDGTNYVSEKRKMIEMPAEMVCRGDRLDLVDWVFENLEDMDMVKKSAVLTLDNKAAHEINNYVLSKLHGEARTFTSIDEPDEMNGIMAEPQVFASQMPSGMPPHKLNLKVGAQVVLLRNQNVRAGLCNGTRLTVVHLGKDVIICTPNYKNSYTPDQVYFHRQWLTASGKNSQQTGFKRLQFPLRLAYASTINKSQGQTLERAGIVLTSPCFSHGQLYVALSRVRNSQAVKVWHYERGTSDDYVLGGKLRIRNIVYKGAFSSE